MKILAIGSKGYLGGNFLSQMANSNHTVRGASRKGDENTFKLDILEVEQIIDFFNEHHFDLVINFAGKLPHKLNLDYSETVNQTGSVNILKSLQTLKKATRLIHISSGTETSNGNLDESQYSKSKRVGLEKLIECSHASSINLTIIKCHNIIGRDHSSKFVNNVIRSGFKNETIEIQYPDRIRDFVWVDDFAAQMEVIVNQVEGSSDPLKFFEIGTGVGTNLYRLASIIYKKIGSAPLEKIKRGKPKFDPNPVSVANSFNAGFKRAKTPIDVTLSLVIEALR